MNQALARDYRFGSLLKFALPTIVMMIFMSLYTIVDGVFVSRFVGTDALSAINIVYPIISIVIGLALMLATGGSAVIARKMGEGRTEEARRDFSLIVLVGVGLAIVIAILGNLFLRPLCYALGASEELIGYCVEYLRILLIFAPASVLQMLFQTFFVAAGRPGLGLGLNIFAGVVNGILDYVFIVPLGMGITGAALATAAGYLIPAVVGVLFFLRRKGSLWFARPVWDGRMLIQSCFNGSSEMVTNLSSAVITLLFNLVMMRLAGEDGVAAITIVLYAQFLLTALYLGFSMGVAPVLSYNYGSANTSRLQKLYRICMRFVIGSSVIVFVLALVFSKPLVAVFAPPGSSVFEIGLHGFRIFAACYLFAGTNIFASAMFTALSDGKTSALISFLRTFVFILPVLLLLPYALNIDGVWLSVPIAELLTLLVAGIFLARWYRSYGKTAPVSHQIMD